jgi:acyl-CoA synthetase (AMP-forming)/AMP-acid ligase II
VVDSARLAVEDSGTPTTTSTPGGPVPSPFDRSGTTTGPDGVRRYTGLADNLLHLLRAAVDAQPDREAVVELGGTRLTYRELWDRSARVAGGLRAAGVVPGDRVAIRFPNGVDWVLGFWGALLAGAVAVPVNTRFAPPEVEYVLGDCGASYVFEPGAPLPDGQPASETGQGRHDLAAIFYTSGTTGFPKGAMTTHENFLSNCETCVRCLELDRDEHLTTLVSVPLFHVTGCNSQLLLLTALAGTTVIMPVFDLAEFLRAIQQERISVLITVPAIYHLALQHPDFDSTDTGSVRSLSYGGAPIAPDLVHRLQKAFPTARVGNGFGLTETSSVSTYLPHEWAAEHADSIGFPAPVVDLDLADVDPVSGVGELLIRGPHVVAGYWGKPEQTAQAFVEGWLHSGDLARIDDQGLVHLVDRKKDMINRGGENVYCVEVENVLAAHPAVGEVAVVGVADEVLGEKVGAVVVLRPGSQLDARELADFASGQLADFKVPQYVAIRSDPLPRNAGGKVLKPALRDDTSWGDPLR